MPQTFATELALRAAVNTNSREITANSGQSVAIKTTATQRVSDQINSNNNGSSGASQMNLETLAIEGAIVGVAIAYDKISEQLKVLDDQRLAFDKERQAGFASFILPTNIEENKLSTEEKSDQRIY